MHRRTIPSGEEREFLNRNLRLNAYDAICCLKSPLLVKTFPSYNSSELLVSFPTNPYLIRPLVMLRVNKYDNIFHIHISHYNVPQT